MPVRYMTRQYALLQDEQTKIDVRSCVALDTVLSNLAGHGRVEEVLWGDDDLFATDVVLVRAEHVLVEYVHGNLVDERVCNPGTIVARRHFAQLVRAHFGHGGLVGLFVAFDWNLCGHAAHSGHTPSTHPRQRPRETAREERTCGMSG